MNQPKDDRSERRAYGELAETADASTSSAPPSISRAHFYVMQREGWGTRPMYLGASVRISPEARRDWRREHELCGCRNSAWQEF